MNPLPAAAARVEASAEALGLAISVRLMPDSTRTAAEAATACGVRAAPRTNQSTLPAPRNAEKARFRVARKMERKR